MNSGWISVHRRFLDSRLFSLSGNTVKVTMFLLLSANHSSKFYRGIEIERGQCIRSLTQIADGCHVSRKAVRYAVEQMVKGGFITIDQPFGAQQGHRITICNYVTYQSDEYRRGTGGAHEGNNEGNTNNKEKNEKKDNKTKDREGFSKKTSTKRQFTPPTREMVLELFKIICREKQLVMTDRDADCWIDRYLLGREEAGWVKKGGNPVRNWKLDFRTWISYPIQDERIKTKGAQ